MKFWTFLALTFSLAASAAEPITVSAVGDIMLGTDYPQNMLPADQSRSLLKAASPYLKSSDIRFGNFEDTFFEGAPQPDGKAPGPHRWLFRTPIEYVERLVEAGFNVVSLANNHSRDFGRAGIESSKSVLRLAGIQFSSKDGEVANMNIRGVSVAVIAADFYKGPRSVVTPESIYQEIEVWKKKRSLVIVSAHVGAEGAGAEHIRMGPEIFLGENRGDSIAFARRAVDLGADLIIMHGPHVVRGLEVYRNHLIVYSLGNFATGPGIDIGGPAGLAPLIQVRLDENGNFLNGNIVSFRQTRNQGTVLDPQKEVLNRMKSLTAADFPQSGPKFNGDGFY